MKKSSSSKRNKKQKISTDKVEKSSFLNSVYLSVEDNKKLINNLNNAYRYYIINSNINDLINIYLIEFRIILKRIKVKQY